VSAALRVEVRRSAAFSAEEAAEWNALLRRSAADSVFLTAEWLRAWAEVVRPARPLVLLARDAGGTLAGAAAFYTAEARLAGTIRYRTLRVMGDHPTGADYPDWLLARGVEGEAAAALARALAGAASEWDCLWMPRLSGWSGARERLHAACAAAGFYWHERETPFSALLLPASMEEYRRALSRENRRDLRRDETKILARPGVEIVRCRSAEEVGPFLDALFDLHARRWRLRGEPGSFERHPRQAEFYRRFAPVAFARGWLRLYGLRDAGELKAVQIGYAYGGSYSALQDGFDPAYLPGAGNVLRARVLEACMAEGLREYDFLGGTNEYKRRWLARPRTGYDVFVGRPALRNALLFTRAVWPTGRYLRLRGLPAA
jgi:CelD/BcsL family acetyltransferase involved in cellulose biosynthesis